MRMTFIAATGLLAFAAVPAAAQGPGAVRLRLEPGSQLSITGTSTLKGFTCKTDKLSAFVEVDPGYTKDLTTVSRPITTVRVTIPVNSLSCGKKQMDENMYKTLKADKNPTITYTLSGYDILSGTMTGFAAKTTGTLMVAGKEKEIDMKINAERISEGVATARGEQALKMTDFGIKPPSFMLGTLRVGNDVKVKFDIKAGPEMIAKLIALSGGAEK